MSYLRVLALGAWLCAACGPGGKEVVKPDVLADVADVVAAFDGSDATIKSDQVEPADAHEDSAPGDLATQEDTSHADGSPDTISNGAFALCGPPTDPPPWVDVDSEGSFSIDCFSHAIELELWNDSVVRLRYIGQQPDLAPDRSYAVVADPGLSASYVLSNHEQGFRICTAEVMIEVSGQDCRLLISDKEGQVVLQDGPSGGYTEGPLANDQNQPWAVTVERMISGAEHFYGFGEKNGPLDKRGMMMWFYNSDVPGYNTETDPLYQSIPFFVGLRGTTAYGVFTDNSYRVRTDMGASEPSRYAVSALGGEIDQYVILGPQISDVVRRYTWLTGRMPLPPKWSIGYHQSRYGYKPASQVTGVAQELRARNIPADGIWLDIDFMDEYRCWTWSETFTSDPGAFIQGLTDLGFHTTVIVDPGLKVDELWPIYQYGLEHQLYLNHPDGTPFEGQVWPGASVYPDFTNPETRAWWGTLIPGVTDVGVEGLWLDMNEPANFMNEYAWTVPDWLVAHGDGTPMTMAEGHNLYGSTMAHATYDGLMELFPERRPFVLTRAGYAGVQRYAAVWTGDVPANWPALESTLPMLLGMGLSGLNFVGSDAGGWSGSATMELYSRWMQLGALSPFFRNHSDKNAEPREPWAYGPVAEDVVRSAIEDRYRLLPYWYALFEESSRTGAPALRPMVWEFQEDPQTHTISDQAMLGPWLLLAPVLKPDVSVRSVYLPAGAWFDFYSGRRYEGPGVVEIPVQLQSLPIFVRSGGIITQQNLLQWTDQAPVDRIDIELYPDESKSSFSVYEDDGISQEFRDGAFSKRVISLQKTEEGAMIEWGPKEGDFVPSERRVFFTVRRVLEPATQVRINGVSVNQVADEGALLEGDSAWRYDPVARAVTIAVQDPDTSDIEVNYEHAESQDDPPVELSVRVQVPAGTPEADLPHIAVSSFGWTHVPMQWSDTEPGVATMTLPVPLGTWFQYKYTRGDWATVEKGLSCVELDNRVGFAGPGAALNDSVESWADGCF